MCLAFNLMGTVSYLGACTLLRDHVFMRRCTSCSCMVCLAGIASSGGMPGGDYADGPDCVPCSAPQVGGTSKGFARGSRIAGHNL